MWNEFMVTVKVYSTCDQQMHACVLCIACDSVVLCLFAGPCYNQGLIIPTMITHYGKGHPLIN